MKKHQKIIELRTAAKCKVAELETKIAFAHSEAAGKRARLMWERAAELDGLEAGSIERFDVLAKYRAKLAGTNEQLAATVARLKYEIQQIKTGCECKCAAAEDDPETMMELPQKTVYCDGSEHSARIVARRLINKLPHIPTGGYIFAQVHAGNDGEYFVCVTAGASRDGAIIYEMFTADCHTADFEANFMEKIRRMFAEEPESGNSHVAEPMARALDAVFGGNPVEEFDNLISDTTVKDRKEGENE